MTARLYLPLVDALERKHVPTKGIQAVLLGVVWGVEKVGWREDRMRFMLNGHTKADSVSHGCLIK